MIKRKKWIRLLAAALIFVCCCQAGPETVLAAGEETAVHHDYTAEEIRQIIEDGIAWKKEESGISGDTGLLNGPFLNSAGTTSGDWYALALGRMGEADNLQGYAAVLEQNVLSRYETEQKLDSDKATEWHRIALTLLSLGQDPTDLAGENGETVDLIADGVYNRGKTKDLGAQGLNGYIWGLLALDSLRYKVPEDASDTRRDILDVMADSQLADGSFALAGAEEETGDVDVTAMAVQALAPYYNASETFGTKSGRTVREIVDAALDFLSGQQTESGAFLSWGEENLESAAQVVLALCALGRNPASEEAFIKNGRTLLDGMMQFRMEDGGFVHSFSYDSENPDARPDTSNSMATEQALCALTALYRLYGNFRSFYDFRPEAEGAVKEQITDLEEQIGALDEGAQAGQIEALLEAYQAVPVSERSYVSDFWKLSDAMEQAGIPDDSDSILEAMEAAEGGDGAVISIFEDGGEVSAHILFTEADAQTVSELPDPVTTESGGAVTALLDKLNKAENRGDYEELVPVLEEKQAQIEAILDEIESINQEILDSLYPYEEISLRDRETVKAISARIGSLSEYDRSRIQGAEDVLRAETRLDTWIRMLVIFAAAAAAAAVLSAVLVIRHRKRRRDRLERQMLLPSDLDDEDSDF